MEQGRPSVTALRVALRRAAHQILDEPRVLEDPIALRIIGPERAAELRARGRAGEHRYARLLRAFLVARSRAAEDALAEAVNRGARHYVILGAGLDTFAYRNPHPALAVFEVDHPATQAWKQRLLAAAGIAIPERLRFVPVDFETQSPWECLRRAGLHAASPVVFSWLGVTMYLTADVVDATLRAIAADLPAGSGVVFDYALPPGSLGFLQRLAYRAIARRVAAAGEPWRSSFDPATLADRLAALGFQRVEDLGPETLNRRYFRGRADRLHVGAMAYVMSAWT